MNISDRGIALIVEFEGERLRAYPDPATGGEPYTIGIGHTGPEVKPGMVITGAQSKAYLHHDLARFEQAVTRGVSGKPTTQNQFDALVSFAFNVGPTNLLNSTLLRKHCARDYAGAKAEFAKWNKANKKVMAGLTRRRSAEAALYGRD